MSGAALVAVFCLVPAGSAVAATDLSITKTANAISVSEGSTLTYTITVTNLGPETATGVTVTDPLPNTVKYVSSSTTAGSCKLQGQKLVCAIGTLEAGVTAKVSSATVTLNVVPRKPGTISNTASVSADTADLIAANNQATITTKVVAKATPTGASCRGVAATIVGTAASETLVGTGGRDVIVAFAGDDVILSSAGRDLICAGTGRDRVGAGSAADRVFGGAGRDFLFGRGGGDALRGGGGNDVLRGGRGPDRIRGGRGVDLCRGGPGLDSIRGCEV